MGKFSIDLGKGTKLTTLFVSRRIRSIDNLRCMEILFTSN
jgi:hypothetical protein|tara:strand:+ start:726 stop:845 length:120 start_codon:yes stop_codon:yes gene_type:complete